MRILLLSPARTDEPLGLMYLSAVLKKAGFEVEGVLFNHEDWTLDRVFDKVDAYQPRVILFSIITGEHVQCIRINTALKERFEFVSVMGGPYATYAPETLAKNPEVDAVGLSECEEAIVEFCQRLDAGEDTTTVDNFWVRSTDNVIVKNKLRPLADPNGHPWPDREVFGVFKEDSTYNIITERGCPYKCTYCFNHSFYKMYKGKDASDEHRGNPFVRFRTTKSVLDEIRFLQDHYPVEQINFHDDIFPMQKKRTLDFCEAYEKSGIGIPFSCSVKAELMDEETITAMAQAHCNKVFMGVEAGNDQIRMELLLRNVSKEQMTATAEMFHGHNIQLFTQSMMGLPGTTIEHDIETMAFNATLRPAFGWVSIFTPYPKTQLADYTFQHGLVAEDFLEWMPNTYHYKTVLNVPHATQINALHKLFSLGVEFPEVIPVITRYIAMAEDDEVDALHNEVFLPFRIWKYKRLVDPDLPVPTEVDLFMARLHEGHHEGIKAVLKGAKARQKNEDGYAAWMGRDGVDASETGKAPTLITSMDRHGAEP